jgi:hypothetical protein
VNLTVYKNDVATPLTCSVAAAAAVCSDPTNSVAFAAGDNLSVLVTNAGGGSVSNLVWTARIVA